MKSKYQRFGIVFLILIFGLLNNKAEAQKYNRVFNLSIADVNLEFKMPKGFKEKDSVSLFNCGDNKMRLGTIIYSIVNNDSSIVIGFFNIMNTGGGKYNPIVNVLKVKNYYADSLKRTTFLYDDKYTRSNLNADVAGEYSRNCPNAFLKKYNNDRIVFMANKRYGEAAIVYFYTDKAKANIEKVIRENSQMLRFINKPAKVSLK